MNSEPETARCWQVSIDVAKEVLLSGAWIPHPESPFIFDFVGTIQEVQARVPEPLSPWDGGIVMQWRIMRKD